MPPLGGETAMTITTNPQCPRTPAQVRLVAISVILLASAGCHQATAPEPVNPQNVSLKNSPTVARNSVDLNSITASAEVVCYWNDKKYSDKGVVCDAHRRYECWNGKWADIGNC